MLCEVKLLADSVAVTAHKCHLKWRINERWNGISPDDQCGLRVDKSYKGRRRPSLHSHPPLPSPTRSASLDGAAQLQEESKEQVDTWIRNDDAEKSMRKINDHIRRQYTVTSKKWRNHERHRSPEELPRFLKCAGVEVRRIETHQTLVDIPLPLPWKATTDSPSPLH